jgi:hypothetical protein
VAPSGFTSCNVGWGLPVAGAGGGPISSLALPIDALEGRLPPLPRGGIVAIFFDWRRMAVELVQVTSYS